MAPLKKKKHAQTNIRLMNKIGNKKKIWNKFEME